MTIGHYENFPVASALCPPALRPPILAIYRFARTADDLADEGQATVQERLRELGRFRAALDAAASGRQTGDWPDVFEPLAEQMARFALPVHLLADLLDAFAQDCGNPIYEDRHELLDYCRRSANPIGRLLLHLYGVRDPLSIEQSDAICTALQLINFWQDPSVDLPRGRSYFPRQDLVAHGLTQTDLANAGDTAQSQALLASLCSWAKGLMQRGAPLVFTVPGRMGWELRFVVQGGLGILARIAAMDHRTFRRRPKLGALDMPGIAWAALRMRRDAGLHASGEPA
ncbi:squalene synthase HpnC [Ideonella sp. A 288]|uniref:squalene synthase HpnC n=1 Tax=Ideonella sp. A 288 TaxID=1962181 RepID=UPI000B4ACCD0|nr:squalene synthase HpnC [Ideonella sp. A 288]